MGMYQKNLLQNEVLWPGNHGTVHLRYIKPVGKVKETEGVETAAVALGLLATSLRDL